MELQGCDADRAKALLSKLESANLPMPNFYAQLQDWVGANRLLVDKTPIYALDPATLRRAEAYFDEVHYIHLLRHPAAMTRSFEEARTDQVFFRQSHAFTPCQLAELVWTVSHQNILAFLQEIPAARQQRVKYEALVADPYRTMQEICTFLGLPFASTMAEPYADKEKRMTDGIYAVSKMLGTPSSTRIARWMPMRRNAGANITPKTLSASRPGNWPSRWGIAGRLLPPTTASNGGWRRSRRRAMVIRADQRRVGPR